MTETLHFTLLGQAEIRHDNGEPLLLPTRKAKALLIYLALAAGKARSREQLALLLWDRSGEEQARASLRQTLSGLRKALAGIPAATLVADADLIRLEAAHFVIDSVRFERLCGENTPAALQQAAGLYQGDFLAGFSLREESFEEWLRTQRERLHLMAEQAYGKLLEYYEPSGAMEQAILTVRQLLALDPLREASHRALMRLYRQQGQRHAALRQYENCVQLLRDELGINPEPATEALHREIAADPAAAPPPAAEPPPPAPSSPCSPDASSCTDQQIHFCLTPDKVCIAYATSGSGPPLVKAAHWLSNLEYDWHSPVWRPWLERLSSRYTLLRYDERGCGMSDWNVDFSFDAWVCDLEAVIATAGFQRFPLLGISQGGAVALAYAVRHPEQVSHLILYGSYARGKFKRDPAAHNLAEEQALMQLIRSGWGQENPAFRQVFTSLFLPDGSAEQHRWFNDLQRVSTSPDNAVRFLETFATIDVQDLAARIEVPTLVLHARGDARVPFTEGRLLAALIPQARFVALDSDNHVLLQSEPALQLFLDEIHTFVNDPALRPALPPPASGEPAEAGEAVLIVDDDGSTRELVTDYLLNRSYRVYQAANGDAMYQILAQQLPDVVLLDIQMPGEDGLNLARALRANFPGLGIIMVSGVGEVADRIVALEMGADDYLTKPFDLRELLARIKSVVRRRKVN
jgi:DNA-binding response OmpR family regulator/pimeloyl-ACP methyl ester carboxylesterase